MDKQNKTEARVEDGIKGKKEAVVEKRMRVPDGGWGWMVVIGAALSNVVLIPVMQCFGLLFKNRFLELEFDSTIITSLISLNSSIGMILGIFNSPLLKRFGYRKMALAGITTFTAGVLLTAFASNYVQFVISYGIITSLGMMVTMASFSLAVNSYFKKRRARASGISMSLTGLGPIFMPLLITELLSSYGVKWAVIILVAVNMHSYVGACLLRPIKWYLKEDKPVEEDYQKEEEEEAEAAPIQFHDSLSLFGHDNSSLAGSRKASLVPRYGRSVSGISGANSKSSMGSIQRLGNAISQETLRDRLKLVENDINYQPLKPRSVTCLDNDDYGDMMKSTLYMLDKSDPRRKSMKFASAETLDDLFIGERNLSWPKIPNGTDKPLINNNNNGNILNGADDIQEAKEEDDEKEKKDTCCSRLGTYMYNLYDLDLFRDPIYLNITVGMSIAVAGEIIFSLLTPFIVGELGLDLERTAVFMSVVATTDLICRPAATLFNEWKHYGSRTMYIIALFLLLITRACLLLTTSYFGLLVIAAGLGLAKGVRTVFWVCVIPDHVPIQKLPSASAIQGLCNGILLLLSGPLIGAIVAINNRYTNLILASNVLTLTTVIMWSAEFAILKILRSRRKRKSEVKPSSK